MKRECRKCKKPIPGRLIIDGKRRNLKNRIHCLECQPFATSRFASDPKTDKQRQLKNNNIKSKRHYDANRAGVLERQKALRKGRKEQLVAALGGKCWICGYNKLLGNLIFHHINPADKLFELSERGMCRKQQEILAEVLKCALICCRCHGEVHAGLVSIPNVKINLTIEDLW